MTPVPIASSPAGSLRPCRVAAWRGAAALAAAAVCLVRFAAAGAGPQPATLPAFVPSQQVPPAPRQEFRGTWVATVNNIDWPSKPGLSTSQQQQELIALLDQAAALHLNAVLFQVRPSCDAMYASRLEPWSEYLTGTMGQAPEPFYDPLAMIVKEAHLRGLELHAWFNPFRARHHSALGPASPRHISKTKPQWVRSYGRYLWMDPSEPGVQDLSLRVILDVVKRYDIDGVHLDDYFYPYKEKDARGKPMDFPDTAGWRRYRSQGGKLSRDDWRRDLVNGFIRKLYLAVKAEKRHVKVGISPFGIWRPGFPTGVNGLDAYSELYADSLKWWQQGWLDYLAPQLYWPIQSKEQSFPALLGWWSEQNRLQRNLWPGLNSSSVGSKYAPLEILNQIDTIRGVANANGQIHWSAKALLQNRMNLGDSLLAKAYVEPAIPPPFSWLDSTVPAAPILRAGPAAGGLIQFGWENRSAEKPARWVLQYKSNGTWKTLLYPGHVKGAVFNETVTPDAVSLRGVGRSGNLGLPTGLELAPTPKPPLTTPSLPSAAPKPTVGPKPAAPSSQRTQPR